MSSTPSTATMTTFGSSTGEREARAQTRVWIAFALLGAGLYAQQFVTLGKLKRALLERAPGDPVNSLAGKAWGVLLQSWSIFTTPADLAIIAVIVGAIGYLLWSEITDHTLTDLFERADSSNRVLYGFLGLATVVITRCYWTRGQVFMGDAETHMLRAWMFVEHFRHFDTPVWSNAWYGGFPLLENYSAFYFIATALLTMLLGGDIHIATKLLLWSCHAGSIFVMFWYLNTVTRRRLPSLIGAMAFALSFFRLHILLYQGDLQVAVVFLLCPLILLLTERYLANRASARTTFVLVTSTLALLIFNHHGYAFFVLVLYVVYLVARLAVTPAPFRDRFMVLVMFGFAEVASLLMNAFLLGPFLFATGEFHGMQNSAFPLVIPNLRAPVMLVKLFKWSALGDGSSLGYIGLSIGVLAVIGSIYALRRRQPAGVGVFACMVAALLMTHNHGSYNVKNVDFFLIFVCALTAWAPIAIVDGPTRFAFVERARLRWGARFPARLTTVIIGLLLLDLGPTTFQSVFRENYEFKQPMYDKVLSLDGPFKLIERQVLTYDPNKPPSAYFDPNKIGVPSAYASTRTPLGFFHEGAGLSFGYTAEIVKNLHRDLNQNTISPTTAAGLYIVGVKYVIFRDRYRWFNSELPRSPLYRIDGDGILQFAHASPLLLSRRVIGTTDVPGYPTTDLIRERQYFDPQTFDYKASYFRDLVQPLLTTIQPDLERGVASTLITRDGDLRQDLGPSEELKSEVLDFTSDLKHVTVRYRSNVDAFGQVPYNYFPYLDVRVDDKPTRFYRSAMNHILMLLPAGEHAISIHGVISPLQERLMWLSLFATIAVVAVPRRLFSSLPTFN